MHRKLVAIFLLVLLSLLAANASGCKIQVSPEDPGGFERLKKEADKVEPAPRFDGELLDGKKVDLNDYRGRPLVVNFWASWCPPCRNEQPEFVRAYDKFKDDVAFLGIDFRDSEAPATKFMRDFKVPYDSVFDPSGRIGFKYGVKALPATFFIDADGNIIRRAFGGVSKKELLDGLELLVRNDKKNAS